MRALNYTTTLINIIITSKALDTINAVADPDGLGFGVGVRFGVGNPVVEGGTLPVVLLEPLLVLLELPLPLLVLLEPVMVPVVLLEPVPVVLLEAAALVLLDEGAVYMVPIVGSQIPGVPYNGVKEASQRLGTAGNPVIRVSPVLLKYSCTVSPPLGFPK